MENLSVQLENGLRHKVQNLIDQYIRSGSPSELNIPQRIRNEIMQEYKKNTFSLSTWLNAYREVVNLMFSNTYARFLAARVDK